jgi:hypothetical protein
VSLDITVDEGIWLNDIVLRILAADCHVAFLKIVSKILLQYYPHFIGIRALNTNIYLVLG